MVKGIDLFFRPVGEKKAMNCLACGSRCKIERDVCEADSFAAAMFGSNLPHDEFSCPHSGKRWHDHAVDLYEAIRKMPSKSVKAMMLKDLKKLTKYKISLSRTRNRIMKKMGAK